MQKTESAIKIITLFIIATASTQIFSYFTNTDYAVATNSHSGMSLQLNENTKNGPIKGTPTPDPSSGYTNGPSDRLKPSQSNTNTTKSSSVSTREQYDYSKSAEEKMSNK